MNTLIRYAGFDAMENQPGYYTRPQPRTRSRLWREFRMGKDTLQIAEEFGLPEWKVLKIISNARAHFHGYPSPYEARK